MSKTLIQSIKYKTFVVPVASSGEFVKKEFQLDNDIKVVRAVQVMSDYPDKAWFRGNMQLLLGTTEIFPLTKQVKSLISTSQVEPKKRYIDLGTLIIEDNKVSINYQDTANTLAAFAAYEVKVEFICFTSVEEAEKYQM